MEVESVVKEPSFAETVKEQQAKWRKTWDTHPSEGSHPHVLPPNRWLDGAWEPIRQPLEEYIRVTRISPNRFRHHLNSSWTQCANMYLPFRTESHPRQMLATFLSSVLNLEVASIDALELEYAAPGNFSPRRLLGERGGGRGTGKTSPDVAMTFHCRDGSTGLYLVENKYTEQAFEPCSATRAVLDKEHEKRGLPGNPEPRRCLDIFSVVDSPHTLCHQEHPEWGRAYWSLLAPQVVEGSLYSLRGCPARKRGYQLLRHQALAQGIADSRLFDTVVHGISYDARNTTLLSCLEDVGLPSFVHDWPGLFKSDVRFVCFTHQHFVGFVREKGSEPVKRWAEYMTERYDYA
ncbi:hypothetical protein ACFLUT_04500 [Chloroflexota bacterium]